jgi:5-methylcytosine-specific restriction endonuclease McrA
MDLGTFLPYALGLLLLVYLVSRLFRDDKPKRRRRNREERRRLWDRAGGKCYYCRKKVDFADAHFDHVVPISQGGSDDDGNLRLAHPHCNLHKGARTPQQAKMRTADDNDRSYAAAFLIVGALVAYVLYVNHAL